MFKQNVLLDAAKFSIHSATALAVLCKLNALNCLLEKQFELPRIILRVNYSTPSRTSIMDIYRKIIIIDVDQFFS